MKLSLYNRVVGLLVFAYFVHCSLAAVYVTFFPLWAFVRPLNKRVYHKLFNPVLGAWCIAFTAVAERWNPIKVRIYGELPAPDKSHIVLSNHKCNLDWLYAMSLFTRCGPSQTGHFSAVTKGVLRRIPVWGWGFKLANFLFLHRNFEKDAGRMQAWMRALVNSDRVTWLILYPEGTRYTDRGKANSDAFAKKLGIEPLQGELLLPRTTGFAVLAQGLRKKVHSVVDMTIGYVGLDGNPLPWSALGTNSLWEAFAGKLPLERVHIHLRVHRLDMLPETDEALRAWCMDRWKEKEGLLKHLAEKKEFPAGYHQYIETPPPYALQNFIFVAYMVSGCLLWYGAANYFLVRAYLFWATATMMFINMEDSPTSAV